MSERELIDQAALAVTSLEDDAEYELVVAPKRRGKSITIPIPIAAISSLFTVMALIIAILAVHSARADEQVALLKAEQGHASAEYERGRADGTVEQLESVKAQCAAERERLKGEIALRDQKLAEADEFRGDMVATLGHIDGLTDVSLANRSLVDSFLNIHAYDAIAATGIVSEEERRSWFDARVMEFIQLSRDLREGHSDGNTQRASEDDQESP